MAISPTTKKMKVLIVDDDKDLLDMLVDIFSFDGFKVITAVDGVDASFKYNNEDFDAIITDIKMPKKDGVKFVQYIQTTEGMKMVKLGAAYKPLPIFLISASLEDYRAELDQLSNVDIIPKPFGPKDVLQKVKRALDKGSSQGPSSASLRFSAGDFVMKEGDPGDDVYFVKSGKLKVTKKGTSGEDIVICFVGVGEIVGEMGFLLQKTRSASIEATQDTELIPIPKEKFDAIINGQPKWFKVLFETIATRLEETTKKFVAEKSRT